MTHDYENCKQIQGNLQGKRRFIFYLDCLFIFLEVLLKYFIYKCIF